MEQQHPDDPLGPVSQAAGYLFAEFARLGILESELFTNDKNFEARTKLSPDPKVREQFNQAVNSSDQLADAVLKQHPEDSNALFSKILALGLRSDYSAMIDKAGLCRAPLYEARPNSCATVTEAKAGRLRCAVGRRRRKLLTGIKPAPVRWMLSLAVLILIRSRAFANCSKPPLMEILLKPFAKLLLAVAALRDKNNEEGCDLLHRTGGCLSAQCTLSGQRSRMPCSDKPLKSRRDG